jgi:hypothetical protein
MSFTGGIKRPSWNSSEFVGETLLGTFPPTSVEWTNV